MRNPKKETIIFEFNVRKSLTSTDLKIIKEIFLHDYKIGSDKYFLNVFDSFIEDRVELEKYEKLQKLQSEQN